MDSILFAIFASVATVSALFMILQRRLIYSVGLMIVVLLSVSGLFLIMNAPFLAIVNAIVYAGAVMVLFVFTAMILGSEADLPLFTNPWVLGGAVGVGGLILLQLFLLIGSISYAPTVPGQYQIDVVEEGVVAYFGSVLFSEYVVVLQAVGLLLLVALVGAVYISRDPGVVAERSSVGATGGEEGTG